MTCFQISNLKSELLRSHPLKRNWNGFSFHCFPFFTLYCIQIPLRCLFWWFCDSWCLRAFQEPSSANSISRVNSCPSNATPHKSNILYLTWSCKYQCLAIPQPSKLFCSCMRFFVHGAGAPISSTTRSTEQWQQKRAYNPILIGFQCSWWYDWISAPSGSSVYVPYCCWKISCTTIR